MHGIYNGDTPWLQPGAHHEFRHHDTKSSAWGYLYREVAGNMTILFSNIYRHIKNMYILQINCVQYNTLVSTHASPVGS